MNTPLFTAEASLYETSRQYNYATSREHRAVATVQQANVAVYPSQLGRRCDSACMASCITDCFVDCFRRPPQCLTTCRQGCLSDCCF